MRNKLLTIGLASVFAMTGITNANLLTNGDFALGSNGTVDPDTQALDWTHYWTGGWINRELNDNGLPDPASNYHYAIGNTGALDNGIFQDVAGTAGLEYQLTADAMLDNWWSPTSIVKIEFMDAANGVISFVETQIVANGFDESVDQTWAPRSVSGVAPAGTVTVRALLGVSSDGTGTDPLNPDHFGKGGGTARFDNADLQVIPEPATFGLIGLFGAGLLFVRRKLSL